MGCESTKLIQAWLARLMASAGGTDKDGYRGNGAFRAPFLYRITRWLAMLVALFQLLCSTHSLWFVSLHSVLAKRFSLCNFNEWKFRGKTHYCTPFPTVCARKPPLIFFAMRLLIYRKSTHSSGFPKLLPRVDANLIPDEIINST